MYGVRDRGGRGRPGEDQGADETEKVDSRWRRTKRQGTFAKVRANVARQLTCAEEGGGQHYIKCPLKAMFTLQMSEVSGQEKSKCLCFVGKSFEP